MFSSRRQPAPHCWRAPVCVVTRTKYALSLWCRAEGLNTRLYRSSRRNQLSGSATRFSTTVAGRRAVCRSVDMSNLSQSRSALAKGRAPTALGKLPCRSSIARIVRLCRLDVVGRLQAHFE